MVAGYHQQWNVWQAIEKLPARLELLPPGPLRQVATCHNGVGGQRREGLQQCLSHRRYKRRSKMQIRNVQNFGGHRCFSLQSRVVKIKEIRAFGAITILQNDWKLAKGGKEVLSNATKSALQKRPLTVPR